MAKLLPCLMSSSACLSSGEAAAGSAWLSSCKASGPSAILDICKRSLQFSKESSNYLAFTTETCTSIHCTIYCTLQCYGSRMIYSGSGYEFLEVRIRIRPMLFKDIWKLFLKASYNKKKNEESASYQPFSTSHYSPCTILQSRIHRPKIWNTILFVCFILAGSKSGQIIPDPQHYIPYLEDPFSPLPV